MPARRAASFALLGLLAACSSTPDKGPPEPPDAGTLEVPPRICPEGCAANERCDPELKQCVFEVELASKCQSTVAPWTPATPTFTDVSAEWGLTGDVAAGTRISVTDLEGDGLADLVLRRAGNHKDDPAGTRAVWVMRNRGDHFEDVTAASGLLQNRTDTGTLGRPAEVVVSADVDNDGDLDLFTGASASSPETSEVMLNAGDGTFTLAPAMSDLRRTFDSVGGASFVDANLDGNVDLWVAGGSGGGGGTQDRLYLGDGAGYFFDFTEPAGLTTEPWSDLTALNEGRAHSIGWGASACDLNGDGLPELLTSSYGRSPNHLWQAQGVDGFVPSFLNRSVASGFAFDQRTDWTDNESARCFCQYTPNAPGCDGVPPPQYIVCNSANDAFRWDHDWDRNPFRLGGNTGTTACGDVDGDGDLDLLNLEIVHWDVGSSSDPSELLYNDGKEDMAFTRPGNDVTGLTRPLTVPWDNGDITGALFDFDNDGRLDVYIGSTDYPGTRAWLYHQKADGTFEPVPLSVGIDHTSSHGVGVADYDRDGDLDLVLGHSRNRCSLGSHCYPDGHARMFRNEVGAQANWLRLTLEGKGSANRAAIGARVTVEAGDRTQTFEVGGGYGHYGIQAELTVHAGLGEACGARVTVRWPDADQTIQILEVPANYHLHLQQGGHPTVVENG